MTPEEIKFKVHQILDSRPLAQPSRRKNALKNVLSYIINSKQYFQSGSVILPSDKKTFKSEIAIIKGNDLNGAEDSIINTIYSVIGDNIKIEKPISNIKEPSKNNETEKRISKGRKNSDEYYVIDLCDEVLGRKAERQKRFDFLKGDKGHSLPVDAYYKDLNLVIEYYERQHTEIVKFFDKKQTVSGVSRGEQRKIYDERRKEILPKHGIELVIISYSDFGDSKNLKRNRESDLEIIKNILKNYLPSK